MLHFDKNGHLAPHTAIEVSMGDFEKTFIERQPLSKTRGEIFEAYQSFSEKLKGLVSTPYYQFLDGSFVTKKLNPNDLDVVTFLDFDAFEPVEAELMKLKRDFAAKGIDAYFQEIYAPYHPNFHLNQPNFVYWTHTFSSDRKKQPKEFVKLNF